MFSFWSNGEDENSENSGESDEERDKPAKPERFRYVSKRDDRPGINLSKDVFQNNRSDKAFREKRKQMNDMLTNVWSVRKDVRVNNAAKASDIGQKSYYSRHGGVSGPHLETNHAKEVSSVSSMTKKWSVPRQTCSYSDNTELNEFDILDNDDIVDGIPGDKIHSPKMTSVNHHPDVHRQNIVNSMKHGVSGPNVTKRELSARTKRAQKFHNAYLRSTGMGMYTPHVSKPKDDHHNHDKQWSS